MRWVEIAKSFILSPMDWTKVVFSDKKLFTLNEIDRYYCWIQNGLTPKRIKKVLRFPRLMVWAMLLPNGLSYVIMKGKQNK